MRLVFSTYVESDLDEIVAYIAEDNPTRAVTFIDEIARRFSKIAESPQQYSLRDDIAHGLRVAVHGRYVILFQLLTDVVRIERVISGNRDLSRLLDRPFCLDS